MMEWNEFCEKVSSFLKLIRERISFSYDDEKISYSLSDRNFVYTKDDFLLLKERAQGYEFQPYSIVNNNNYEVLVSFPEKFSRRHLLIDGENNLRNLVLKDEEVGVTYSFQEISEELIWYIIKDYNSSIRVRSPYLFLSFDRRCEEVSTNGLFGLLRLAIRIPFSLSIKADDYKDTDEIQGYAKSFLFNFAYNFDCVIKTAIGIEELFPERPSLKSRRFHSTSEIMVPQLLYKQELVEQYYMALDSEDPFVKFIGFYHIMEHFYEDVYTEDMYEKIKSTIQHPGFSVKRKKELAKIVNIVSDKTRRNREEFQGSELEALELTIKKFIDINELINDLSEIDSSILDYYKLHEVSFSKGDMVDLREVSNEKLYKKMAARIYKTRNALVHSKSNEGKLNERGIYKPFNDNKELSKEIPLMRYIAETIIIKTASSI